MGFEKQEITDRLSDGAPAGVTIAEPGEDVLKAQAVSRRSVLAGLGLLLATCGGISPALRQRNPFAEKLTPEEAKVLEKLYAAFEKLDQHIEKFAGEVGKVDKGKMTIEEAELLEMRLNALLELLKEGLAVEIKLSEYRDIFKRAVDHFKQTAIPKLAEKYSVCERWVKMTTESVYTKHVAALTDDNFGGEVLENSDVYIVMVSAQWCPSCHDALPLIAKFGRKGTAGVKIGRAVIEDVDRNTTNPKMKAFFMDKVPGFPAYVVFIKGRPVVVAVGGLNSPEDLDRIIQKARENGPQTPPPAVEPDNDIEPEETEPGTPTGPIIEA